MHEFSVIELIIPLSFAGMTHSRSLGEAATGLSPLWGVSEVWSVVLWSLWSHDHLHRPAFGHNGSNATLKANMHLEQFEIAAFTLTLQNHLHYVCSDTIQMWHNNTSKPNVWLASPLSRISSIQSMSLVVGFQSRSGLSKNQLQECYYSQNSRSYDWPYYTYIYHALPLLSLSCHLPVSMTLRLCLASRFTGYGSRLNQKLARVLRDIMTQLLILWL